MRRPASTPGIFISYRRDDSSGFAGRLYDRLAQRFGADRVFMDIDTIRPGHEFAADIERALSECGACIVLIGRNWESITLPDGRRRLDEPTDFVRLEVAAAIRRGVAVFPVLVEGAKPPSAASLPEEIRDVSGRQAIELSNERWNYDVGRLLLALDEAVGKHKRRRLPRIPVPKPAALIVGAAILLSLAGTIGWIATRPTTVTQNTPSPSVPPSTAGQLSGTYDVSMVLRPFTKSTLGDRNLWGEKHPKPGDSGDSWKSQPWVFERSGSGIDWTVPTPNKHLTLEGSNGTYSADNPSTCADGSSMMVYRNLDLPVSHADTDGNILTFSGTLKISWTCTGPFIAVFDITGKRRA